MVVLHLIIKGEGFALVSTGAGISRSIRGMLERISRHRDDRDVSWRTVEEYVEIWDVIGSEDGVGREFRDLHGRMN